MSLVLIADALLLDTAAAQTLVARCSIFAMEMLGRTHVGCTVAPRLGRATNADIAHHYRRLLTPDGQRTVEELLAASAQPPLLYVSAQTAMTPSVITNARCEGSSTAVVDYARTAVVTEKEEEALCNLTEHARTYSRLQLLVRNSLPVLSVAIAFVGGGFGSDEVGGGGGRGAKGRGREFTEASEAERSANDIIIVECAMMSVNVDGGCVASSCHIPAPSAARASAAPLLRITNVTFAPATLLTSVCADPHMSVSARQTLANVDISTDSDVHNIEKDFTAFLMRWRGACCGAGARVGHCSVSDAPV